MPIVVRKVTRLTTYIFFLLLTAIASVFFGNKKSSTHDQNQLINFTPEVAQADVPFPVDAGCADGSDGGGGGADGGGGGGGSSSGSSV